MSLVSLSSKIYTIKSRRNIPFSTAFASMIREDLAMRYSVFNIVKNLTGSEMVATIAQAKYGTKTPIEKEEEKREKTKAMMERRFKKFTVDSIVTLNNKLNTLSSITERNTTLIENLYNDLGAYRNQKRFSRRDMNAPYTRTPLRSRTVKFQIDDIRAQLNALQIATVGAKRARRMRSGAAGAGVGATFGGLIPGVPGGPGGPDGPDGQTPATESGGMLGTALDILSGVAAYKVAKTGYRFIRRKFFPTSAPPTATPVRPVPTATPAARTPMWNANAQRWQDPATGRFVRPPAPSTVPTTTPTAPPRTPPTPATAERVSARSKDFFKWLKGNWKGFAKSSIVFEVARQAGPENLGRIATGMMEMRDEERAKAQAAIAKFGIKFITGPNKTTVGYEIDGKRYNKFEDLPTEFQNIINAYSATDLRSYSSRAAIADIAENPNKYKVLETREGRAQVLEPPTVADIDSGVIRAAMAAKLTVTEPQLTTPNIVDLTTIPKIETGTPSAVADSATSVSSPGKFTNNDQFVQVMLPLARSAAEQLGNPALTLGILGQWAGETDAGRRLSADFNYAGIKAGNKYAKGSYVLTEEKYNAAQLERAKKSGETLERVLGPDDKITKGGKQYTVNQFYGGGKDVWQEAKDQGLQWVQVRSHFAKFNSLEDFVSAYVSVLKNKRYASAIQATDPKQFGLLVAQAGYATAGAAEYSKKVGGMVARLGLAGRDSYEEARTSSPILIAGTPGAAVASPPAPVAVAAATEEPNKAEVAGQAALVANKIVQKNVVALAGKVATLDKESKLDRQFPSVRNSEFGVT